MLHIMPGFQRGFNHLHFGQCNNEEMPLEVWPVWNIVRRWNGVVHKALREYGVVLGDLRCQDEQITANFWSRKGDGESNAKCL